MRLARTLRYDMLFQLRHGFYYVYILITAIYVLTLLYIPIELRPVITTLLLFTESAALGAFFIGAIVLLEKGQNIHDSLFVTPLRIYEYLISKVVSLAFISLVSALAIILLIHGMFRHLFVFIAGLALSCCFYTLFGFIFAAWAKTVNDYFAKSFGIGLLICSPVLGYLRIFETPLYYIFPTQATLILLDIAFTNYSTLEIIYAFVCLVVWSIAAAVLAYRVFYKHIFLKIGTGS